MKDIEIPKNLFHIWIGDRAPPTKWMDTWKAFHPNWAYKQIDNSYLKENQFINQHLIDEYILRNEYAGAADLIRYEVLYKNGGFMPEADAVCMRNTDELWTKRTAYTVYENELVRGKLVSPILACEKGNPFVKILIVELSKLKIEELGKAWRTTGNYFVAQMLEKHANSVVVFPSHYFIPRHFTGYSYDGPGPVYADQMFGETTNGYAKLSLFQRTKRIKGKIRSAFFRKWRKKS